MNPGQKIALNQDLMPCPTLLLARGRKEIFQGALATSIIIALAITSLAIIIVLISTLLEPIMPPLVFEKFDLDYHAYSISRTAMLLAITPIAFIISVQLRKHPALKIFITVIILEAVVVGRILLSRIIGYTIGIETILIIAIAMWTIFVITLHRVCTKSILVNTK
jgi:hypothetical protein